MIFRLTIQKAFTLYIIFFIAMALVSCANLNTKPPPPSGVRKYTYNSSGNLYEIIASVFHDNGYQLAEQIPDKGYFGTVWAVVAPGSGFRSSIRRKYEVTLTKDFSIPNLYHLHFRVFEQQKAPWPKSKWKKNMIERPLEDKRYLELLKEIDDTVFDKGGELFTGGNYRGN